MNKHSKIKTKLNKLVKESIEEIGGTGNFPGGTGIKEIPKSMEHVVDMLEAGKISAVDAKKAIRKFKEEALGRQAEKYNAEIDLSCKY